MRAVSATVLPRARRLGPRAALAAALATLALSACGGDDAKADDAKADTASASDADATGASDATGAAWGKAPARPKVMQAAGKGPIQVGVATRFLDGPVGVSMAGYGARIKGRRTHWSDKLKGSAGFYGLQSIKVVVIEVGGERMALVKSPLMSSESYLTDAIARHLDEDHKLDFKGRVITMAGHSHHTTARYWPLPDSLGNVGADSFDGEVAETAAALFADAIAEAYKGRVAAEWAHKHWDDWDPKDEVYRDRRGENDPTYGKDPRLTLLAFRRKADAAPLAAILHFPIHGTVFGDDNDMLSEDAPGAIEHKFEEAFFRSKGAPIVGLYSNGAGGDASPAGDGLGHPGLARLERLGEAAAPKVLQLYDQLSWKADSELAIRSQRLDLWHERLYEGKEHQDEFENEVGGAYAYGGWQCKGSGVQPGESMQGKPKLCVDIGKFLELLEAPVPHGEAHQVYLTSARLGDLWLITMPGEPGWSVVKYAREQAAKRTWKGAPMELVVLGYSQDHLLYLLAPDDWFLGGYESEMSLWGPRGGLFLADEGLELIDEMAAGFNAPAFFEESPSLSAVASFSPRSRERSLAAGTVVTQPAATVARVDTARFAAVCGDPVLGSPRLTLQRKQGSDWQAVAPAHGHPGAAYDNSRYEMISAYDPDPPQLDKASVAERKHLWRFYWQVPPAMPTGDYRLRLQCNALDGDDVKALTMESNAFAVGPAEGATLTAAPVGAALHLTMRVPGRKEQGEASAAPGKGKWTASGYRLLDRDVGHLGLAKVRADLEVELLADNGEVLAKVPAPFDAKADANVVAVPDGGAEKATSVRAWIKGDAVPAKVTATIGATP